MSADTSHPFRGISHCFRCARRAYDELRDERDALIDKFHERLISMKALLDQGSHHMVAAKLMADISALEAMRAQQANQPTTR